MSESNLTKIQLNTMTPSSSEGIIKEEVNETVSSGEYREIDLNDLLDGENVIWTSDPTVEIKRKVSDDIEPITLYDILCETTKLYGSSPAYSYKKDDETVIKTWRDFFEDVKSFACSLIAKNFEEYTSVMIQGFNSYEWVVSHFATILAY